MYFKGRLMSVLESVLLVFSQRATMIQFFVILPTVCILDWIGCGSEYTELSCIGLDWVIKLLDWVGLDLARWTHVQLWYVLPVLRMRSYLAIIGEAKATPIGRILKVTHQGQHRGRSLMYTITLFYHREKT